MTGYKATRSQMGDMANSLQRDPQLESILAGRKKDLGISETGASSPLQKSLFCNVSKFRRETRKEIGIFATLVRLSEA
jgi:hypothetical protein